MANRHHHRLCVSTIPQPCSTRATVTMRIQCKRCNQRRVHSSKIKYLFSSPLLSAPGANARRSESIAPLSMRRTRLTDNPGLAVSGRALQHFPHHTLQPGTHRAFMRSRALMAVRATQIMAFTVQQQQARQEAQQQPTLHQPRSEERMQQLQPPAPPELQHHHSVHNQWYI